MTRWLVALGFALTSALLASALGRIGLVQTLELKTYDARMRAVATGQGAAPPIAMVLIDGRAGEIYNIGGGTELTNRELTQLLLDATGKDWSSVDKVQDRLGHDLRYSVDISKIQAELGYRPLVPFEIGLAEVVQWYRDNRAWWEPLKSRAALI